VERFVAGIRYEPPPAWTDVASGVQVRRMVEGNGSAINLYRISPRRRFEAHRHPFPELGVVMAGRGRMIIAGEERIVEEGDSFYIPAGTLHGFAVTTREPAVILDVTVPQLPDVPGPDSAEMLRLSRQLVRTLPDSVTDPDDHDAAPRRRRS
jgi:quercetin dioxygenase-like cupin family protein